LKPVISVALSLALLFTNAVGVLAKELPDGPVAVMTPQGRTFILQGSEARAFVQDANSLQCEKACDSPAAAAKLAEGPVSGATSERYLVAFNRWGGGARFNWTAAAWFYPSTREEPPHLVWPIGVGDERGAWAEWLEATPRMERIVLGSASSSALPITGSTAPFHALLAIALAIAVLGLLLINSSRMFDRSKAHHDARV
jgi:hypothetical protein